MNLISPLTTPSRFDAIQHALTEACYGRAKLFSDRSFSETLDKLLDDALAGGKILSLDVFDTLVLRDNSSELTRFYEIGKRMAEIVYDRSGRQVTQVDAFAARYLGTKATYRASATVRGCREGSLSELHKTASWILSGSPILAEAFIEAELTYEATRITSNPWLWAYVDRYIEKGGRVVLVSDMYMHAPQIVTLLDKIGWQRSKDVLLVSSADTKVSKASGGIFGLIETSFKAAPSDFIHLGDSLKGDMVQPVRNGWGAIHLPLASYDIAQRQADHFATVGMLKDKFGLLVDIALPR
ncbi:HAD family hydrolase [Sinirhodobacter populi]|uniref:HAD family hydrolase n=1 Tax=Paenirhodobacter populi TaxID=2306993 RepID=A0A443JXV2_9RHOB|nr:HAD family hydrolase [Sinirhodobacter populi]RWR25352.1 HAD family hydrolase [Sinirhodobacter populi]